MAEILLRARLDPFTAAEPERVLVRNLVGDNSGNRIFSDAAFKLLDTPGTTVAVDRFKADPSDAPEIDARYSHYVIPLANAFRISFEATLIRMTRLIRSLRIPVTILGVGAQSNVTYEAGRLSRIDATVKDFVAAVLDHSPSIGVRGEFTAEYLRALGFRDVEVIGCPSLFLPGAGLRIEKHRPTLERDDRLAINVSPYVTAMGPILVRHLERYPNLTYVAQDLDTLELLLWGSNGATEQGPDDPRPVHLDHPVFRQDKVRYFTDPWPWFRHLAEVDFSFGTRIHGNIAALIAGTPAVVLAHDSRTLELARYFEIPYRLMRDVPPDVDAADLFAEADFTAFNAGHETRLRTFLAYLEQHGLDHIHRSGEPDPSFDARKDALAYPPPVTVASRLSIDGPRSIARRIRHRRRRWRRHRWVLAFRKRMARGLGRRPPRVSQGAAGD
jgi:hypothetical protein